MASGPQAIKWDKVPATKVTLFYPGQSSYQWLRSDAHKGAAKETARGDACVSCHDDPKEEQLQGNKTPVPGAQRAGVAIRPAGEAKLADGAASGPTVPTQGARQ